MIRALAQLAQVLPGRPPERIVCDAHSDSTRLAVERVAQTGAKVIQVQHHHAHIAAVQAEYGADRPLPGLASLVASGQVVSHGGCLCGPANQCSGHVRQPGAAD